MNEKIELEEIEKTISDYIKETKGQDVDVNVLKYIPKGNNFTNILASIEINKALAAYEYIKYKNNG